MHQVWIRRPPVSLFVGAVALLPLQWRNCAQLGAVPAQSACPTPTGTEDTNERTNSSFDLRSVSPLGGLKSLNRLIENNKGISKGEMLCHQMKMLVVE